MTFPKHSATRYGVVFDNGVSLGELLQEVDGYFVFYPDLGRGGYWDQTVLEPIVQKLNDLNWAWDKEVREALGRIHE